jgi:hypothetical protein
VIEVIPAPPWVRQRLDSPAVYLDHWALRRFSERPAEGERLKKAILSRNGTLVISWANVVEFAAMNKDTKAGRAAETFIDAHWPNLYFLRSEPFEVVRREDERGRPQAGTDAASDEELLDAVAYNSIRIGVLMPEFAGVLATVIEAKAELHPTAERLKSSVREAVLQRLKRIQADPEERNKVESAPTQAGRPRATLAAGELLLRELFRISDVMELNDSMDLLHAAVPLAYCDYVLLDGRWRDLADRAISGMRAAGVKAPLAKVYSGKKGEVEKFLEALATGQAAGAEQIEG